MINNSKLLEEYNKESYSSFKVSKLLSEIKSKTDFPLVSNIKVALLGTVTLDFLQAPLILAGALESIDVDVQVLPSEQIMQNVIEEKSKLYAFGPDVISILARIEDLYPPLFNCETLLEPDLIKQAKAEVLGQISGWIESIRKKSGAVVILHSFLVPDWSSDITNETLNKNSIWMLVQELNLEISNLANNYTGVYLLNTERIRNNTPEGCWWDSRLWYIGRIAFGSKDPRALINSWVPILKQVVGLRQKCLVVDLDNTMWGGVVGEDGLHGIKIGQDYPGSVYRDVQKQILDLWHSGVMLAIASKNNEADAKEVFDKNPDMILKWEHFQVKKVNWSDKATNLIEISKELNISLDHMVFLDDNPVECDLINQELPSVTVLEVPVNNIVQYPQLLILNRLFDGSRITDEDRMRNQMYTTNTRREDAKKKSSNINDFLRSLCMSSLFLPVTEQNISRSYQMLTKTNQFNLTTIRYTESEVKRIASDPQWLTITASLTDKFGDNGQVGLMFIKLLDDEAVIDTFLMSCRVIGRTLETAIIIDAINKLRALGVTCLKANFLPTPKNELVQDLYESNGFDLIEKNSDGSKLYRMNLSLKNNLPAHYITIK